MLRLCIPDIVMTDGYIKTLSESPEKEEEEENNNNKKEEGRRRQERGARAGRDSCCVRIH